MSKQNSNGVKGALANNSFVRAVGTQRLIAVLALIVLFLFFCAASPAFRQYSTFVSIFDASYYIGFMAIGVTFVIITGGIDLSIGTVLVCSSLISGSLAVKSGLPIWICLIIGILIGTLFGLLNGIMVSIMGLPPFIASLGTMMITRGLGSIYTKAQSITWPQASEANGWFRSIFKVTTADNTMIPTGLFLLIILAVIMSVFLNKSKPGRYILALGSNKEATRLSGVNVVKWETLSYIISGTFAGLAGISYAAIYSTMLPSTGNGYELDAIAGVVIGGTSMSGGSGTIAGTLIGVFIMSVLKTGLPFIGLQNHWQTLITGIVLIIAVFADVVSKRKKN
ncbi:MAG: ABC transporter permease [Lachnospiraceae bacterium]